MNEPPLDGIWRRPAVTSVLQRHLATTESASLATPSCIECSTRDINRLARGIYLKPGIDIDCDLAEIALRVPRATLCLTSALARHSLTDDIPPSINVALPRNQRHPRTAVPVTWHPERGNQPSELLRMAKLFPKAEPTLRTALETLL